jgi:hypothetical protein
MSAIQLAQTLIKNEWMVIGKLQEQQVTSLSESEVARAFSRLDAARWCTAKVAELIERGLTFEMLSEL